MTSTWTDVADGAIGDQLTAEIFTDIADDLDFLRNPPSDSYAPATSDATITTTSTSFVTITGFSLDIVTQGNPIEIMFDARVNSTNMRFDIAIDGVSITADNDGLGANTPISTFGMVSTRRRVELVAGTYTITMRWRVTSGTGSLYPPGLAQFYAVERA